MLVAAALTPYVFWPAVSIQQPATLGSMTRDPISKACIYSETYTVTCIVVHTIYCDLLAEQVENNRCDPLPEMGGPPADGLINGISKILTASTFKKC